ncbi:MAG: hypothetical protein DHS20C14_01440 [Phycisphaeraceae bacterium]|nr:MAG: hypothetical protein DHS20C14_01440 [Phycisphaeraceae bacterium]
MNLNPSSGQQASFLPEDYVKSKGQHRANVLMLLLFGAVSIGTIGAFMLMYKEKVELSNEVRQVRTDFEAETTKIDQLRALEAQRIEILERAEVVTAIIERVPRSVLTAEIARAMPQGVALTELDLVGERVRVTAKPKVDADKTRSVRGVQAAKKGTEEQKVLPPRFNHTITLTGLAALNNDVADYLAALKDSPLFTNVELQYINQTTIDDTELRKFRIVMGLRETPDVAMVAEAHETSLLDEQAVFGVTVTDTETE